ncbi:MAG: hypothetical protein JSW10_10020 [Pseudomonadota bacterium]|nr:MAG: hypothetical protein JSW10_10020 [Pseudomonadota bacterium]
MSQPDPTAKLIRIAAGVLALMSFGLVGLRLYALSGYDAAVAGGESEFISVMKLLFPATLGLFFAYLAWKGKLPFSDEKQKR